MNATAWRQAAKEAELLLGFGSSRIFEQAARSAWWRLGPDDASAVYLRLSREPNGEISCSGVAFGLYDEDDEALAPARITATALHSLPLQAVLAELARRVRDAQTKDVVKGRKGVVTGYEMATALFGADGAVPLSSVRARPGAKGFTDDDLREFARAYRQARKEQPRTWTKFLAKQMSLSRQAIRYQRKRAEERGFLRAADTTATTQPRRGRRR